MTQAKQKLDQLTSTRFLAALSVVLYHGWRELGILSYFPMFTSGPTAVSYFFVLSGFVITLAYYRPDTRFDFRNYFVARFSRIYPVYILAFVLTCLYYLEIMSKVKSGKILANIFLYQAWIPRYGQSFNIAAWSLSVEVFFYIVFPFLAIFIKRFTAKQLLWISLVFWVVSQIIHSILYALFMPEQSIWLNYFPPFHLNAFFLGMAGGVWYLTNPSQQNINQSMNRALLIASLGFVLLMISLREYVPTFSRYFTLDIGLLAPFFLVIILALALDTTILSQRLKHPWLALLGDSSYALFILHLPFLWLFTSLLRLTGITITDSAKFFIHILVSISLSIVVFKYIERPARDWLRTNYKTLPLILLDIILIIIMVRLSFALRLGDGIANFLRTQTFAIRIGVVSYFISLLVFRYYTTRSWQSLAAAVMSGTVILTGFVYLAWTSGWIEGFPRSILLLIPVMIFMAIYLSRFIAQFLRFNYFKMPKHVQ